MSDENDALKKLVELNAALDKKRLRDVFAAAALTGLCSYVGFNAAVDPDMAAVGAYRIADAMMRERE